MTKNNKKDNLEDKAVNIKGKKYVLVKDRVAAFDKAYDNGAIQTKLIKWEGKRIIFKAKAIPDVDNPDRYFTGYAQEVIGDGHINQDAALENAETSAVGRALAFMNIGVIESIASVDEVNKATNRRSKQSNTQNSTNTNNNQQSSSTCRAQGCTNDQPPESYKKYCSQCYSARN